MEKPNHVELENARDMFRALLQRTTAEVEWQSFFARHPYVLSRSLPIRLEPSDIVPLGRPGSAEPDFIFYPRESRHIPFYGVIEIKRPDSRIITATRSDVAILSRDAETAIQQAQHYADQAWSRSLRGHNPGEMLFLGSTRYLFVVMGLSNQLATAIGLDVLRGMLERRLPPDLQILPYDTLLARFEAGIRRRVLILVIEDRLDEPPGAKIGEAVARLSEGAKVEFLYLYKSRVEGWVRSGYQNPHKDLLYTHLVYRTRDGERKVHTVHNYEPTRYAEVIRWLGGDECIVRPDVLRVIEGLSLEQRFALFDGIELLDASDDVSPD